MIFNRKTAKIDKFEKCTPYAFFYQKTAKIDKFEKRIRSQHRAFGLKIDEAQEIECTRKNGKEI